MYALSTDMKWLPRRSTTFPMQSCCCKKHKRFACTIKKCRMQFATFGLRNALYTLCRTAHRLFPSVPAPLHGCLERMPRDGAEHATHTARAPTHARLCDRDRTPHPASKSPAPTAHPQLPRAPPARKAQPSTHSPTSRGGTLSPAHEHLCTRTLECSAHEREDSPVPGAAHVHTSQHTSCEASPAHPDHTCLPCASAGARAAVHSSPTLRRPLLAPHMPAPVHTARTRTFSYGLTPFPRCCR